MICNKGDPRSSSVAAVDLPIEASDGIVQASLPARLPPRLQQAEWRSRTSNEPLQELWLRRCRCSLAAGQSCTSGYALLSVTSPSALALLLSSRVKLNRSINFPSAGDTDSAARLPASDTSALEASFFHHRHLDSLDQLHAPSVRIQRFEQTTIAESHPGLHSHQRDVDGPRSAYRRSGGPVV